MKRILFDTSVYGKLVYEQKVLELIRKKYKKDFIIYGCSTIRHELRDTLKHIVHDRNKLRILLLNIYDIFIVKENHDLNFNRLIETLSNDYFREYKKNGGSLSNKAIKNDLVIIATATIYQLDIIVSDDERTMFSYKAIKSYKEVNKKYGLRDPEFKTYEKFKKGLM